MQKEERQSYDELLKWGTKKLAKEEIADAALDAWYLLAFVSGLTRAEFFLKKEELALQEDTTRYQVLIEKRAAHIPLQHLTREQEFMGLSFFVNDKVLVPRQDTECLVERTLPFVKDKRVLDMCTGSGCIAISLALLGKPAFCMGADYSKEALLVAQKNAKDLQAEVTFVQGDLFENVEGIFDVIVSNPPYIPPKVIETLSPEVKEHEPYMALDGGEDGLLFYRRIAKEAKAHLAEHAGLFLEIGCEQGLAVSNLLESEGYREVMVYKDYAGKDRIVTGRYEYVAQK